MTEPPRGYVVQVGTGLDGDPSMKASSLSTGGALSVFETTIDGGPPLHVHEREDECFYLLEGELFIRCDRDFFSATAGSFVFLPRRRPHRFQARTGSARLLLIAVPGGIEDYFQEINAAAATQELHRVGEKYGIRVVPE